MVVRNVPPLAEPIMTGSHHGYVQFAQTTHDFRIYAPFSLNQLRGIIITDWRTS